MSSEYHDEESAPAPEFPSLTDEETEVESQERVLQIETASQDSNEPDLPLPIWMREQAKAFRYKWVPLPVRKAARATAVWVKGPDPPCHLTIKPLFPRIQEAPIKLLGRFAPKQRHRIFLLFFVYCVWFLVWALMVRHNSTDGYIQGFGKPSHIWCGATFWNGGNGCGLNGNNCRPFAAANMAFRCPAECKSTKVMDPYYVGNQSFNYQGIVIGGPNPEDPESTPVYRADSFICQAAIHAGVITDGEGGCGVASLIGSYDNYPSTKRHGIESIEFPSPFPRSFAFHELSASQAQCPKDSRWPIFVVTAVALVLISVFTTSTAAFFWSTFIILMLHVGIVSDPPNDPTMLDLISKFLSRFLPACFVAWIFYRYSAIALLKGLTAQIEKTVLFLGFAFIGALNNYTFASLIPLERLTPHDLKAQPGAPFALAVIIVVILSIVVSQIHFLRISGLLPRYLKIYISMVIALLILLALPGLRLRIHHYILAMLFMPGTALQTRPCLIYQGLLLGLFINGIARWGFDSIAQTPATLGESGGNHGGSWWGATSPNITAVVSSDHSNLTFDWGELPTHKGVDGVSILINDVERWRGYLDEELFWHQTGVTMEKRRGEENTAEFFRFAWLNGGSTGLFGEVGTWDENGVWHYSGE